MKHRSPLLVFLLVIVTFGIYGIYWLYKTREELLAYSPNKRAIPSILLLFAPILFILAVLLIYLVTRTAGDLSTLGNILIFLGGSIVIPASVIIPFVWFYRYTATVDTVSGHKNSLYLFFILLFIFGLLAVWYAIAQNALNQIGAQLDRSNGTAQPFPQSYPSQPNTPLQ